MKTLLRWLVIHIVLFALVAVGGHWWFKNNPRRVLVAVDASFDAAKDWDGTVAAVNAVDDNPGPYTVFALVTDKGPVHGWQKTLELGNIVAFGPRNFEVLEDDARFPLIDDATERLLVTNAPKVPSGWTVVRP